IDRSLTLTDIARGMSPVNRAALNADVILLKRRGEVVGLSIWSLATGKLVYADVDPRPTAALGPAVRARAPKDHPVGARAPAPLGATVCCCVACPRRCWPVPPPGRRPR